MVCQHSLLVLLVFSFLLLLVESNQLENGLHSFQPRRIVILRSCLRLIMWQPTHKRTLSPATLLALLDICSVQRGEVPLYEYAEVPLYLRHNPYVVSGYRCELPMRMCWKSLFVWNNESFNIWSHGLAFLFFFLMMLYDNVYTIPHRNGHIGDHLVLSIGLGCFMVTMACSTGYHLFMCQSEHNCNQWFALDLAGISVGILGCYLPAVHYAFYCLSLWRDAYLFSIIVMFMAILIFQTSPRFLSEAWYYRRLIIYVFLGAYGIVPSIHWVIIMSQHNPQLVQLIFPKVLIMYFIGALAVAVYLTKFPERWFPGRFDFIGSSHNLWHLLVVAAFVWWRYCGLEIFRIRSAQHCHDGY